MKVYLDFEFNKVLEEKLNLVSCSLMDEAIMPEEYWLHDLKNLAPRSQIKLKKRILEFKKQYRDDLIFVAYSVEAEARSFIALGLDPMDFQWIDLYVEWMMVTNHNHKMAYGRQYIVKDGKGKFIRTFPPSGYGNDRLSAEKRSTGMASAAYKLCNIKIDSDRKNKMRDIIISQDEKLIEENKKEITEYNTDDIMHLPRMLDSLLDEYERLLPESAWDTMREEMLLRGQYAALTAWRSTYGYPINFEWTRNLGDHVEDILSDVASEINEHHPDINPFSWVKSKKYFKKNDKNTRAWVAKYCEENGITDWPEGKTGHSLETKQFEKYFNFRHDYPLDNFGAQMLRYKRARQSFNGFIKAKTGTGKRKKFWDSYDKTNNVVRPFMGIYGAQSSRSQPAATGFIPLKAAWVRALIQPPPGDYMGSLDYKAEEFFIRAIESGDKNMIAAYLSGDAYMWTAINDGFAPEGATKATHPFEREVFKVVALSLQYGMTKYGLAYDLSMKLGRKFTPDEAQGYIDRYYALYVDNYLYTKEVYANYISDGYIKLPCGWYMFGDNPNERSVVNCPGQGLGASAMRRADVLAYKAGLKVPYTLHDALYIWGKHGSRYKELDKLAKCMVQGFVEQFDTEEKRKIASKIMLDGDLWGPEFPDKVAYTKSKRYGYPIKEQNVYIDERASEEYEKFNKYFTKVKSFRFL